MSEKGETRCGVLRRILDSGDGWIHMSGVLGVSMSSLALMLAERGISVSGSDDGDGSREKLRRAGVYMNIDRRIAICSADALVYSSAVSPSHPDRRLGRKIGIPEYSRAELLGALMGDFKERIGVSGTHGKSTVTAMLASIFTEAELSPTVLCGARMQGGESYISGKRDYLLYEACEYRDSFLHFSPTCAIITNIELDHTDYFESEADIAASFFKSAESAQVAVVSVDYPASEWVARALGDKAVTVGRSGGAEYRYETVSSGAHGSRFAIYHCRETPILLDISVVGEYNIDNAAIAAVTAMLSGIPRDKIASGLRAFRGVNMRLERLGMLDGRVIYRDYAHHPTEIRCALGALKAIHGSVAVLFRPHTYTRTRDLWQDFVRELSVAAEAGIYEIYPARESPIPGISAEALAGEIDGACSLMDSDALDFVLGASSSAIVLMGAGDLSGLEHEILRCIREREK